MAPVRVGFLGLSASGCWASRAHLPYLQQSEKYEIVALSNSSVEAAQAAKKEYKLAEPVKTYGNAQDLADDPDVEMVVCSVRVDRHYETLKPALEAGKDVFVEWPLAHDLKHAEELLDLSKKSGSRVMVGFQARRSPFMNKVKEIVGSGKIGKVLSSIVTMAAGNFGATLLSSVEYMADAKVGGNMLSIHFSHPIDAVIYTLNDEINEFDALLSTQRKTVDLIDTSTKKTIKQVEPDTPDQIMVQGTLHSGAVTSIHMRGGPPFKGEPGFVWRIYGETGELLVTADSAFVNMGSERQEIRFHDHANDTVETIDWLDSADELEKLPLVARNVGRLYESFADGRTGLFANWEDAVLRHRMVDQIQKSALSSQLFSYLPEYWERPGALQDQ